MSFKIILLHSVVSFFLLCSGAVSAAININTATAEQLANEIKGVGLKKAERIVDYREQYGPFKSVMDLALVKGIGAKTIQTNLENLLVEDEPSAKK